MQFMSDFEVPDPIINSPYREPEHHWNLMEGQPAELKAGRRPASYFYRDPKAPPDPSGRSTGAAVELRLVNLIRERVQEWRKAGYPNATRTTQDLLAWWQRDGRKWPLFFAQLEAAETIIFLKEARADLLQGLEVPREEVSADRQAAGVTGFERLACKMATGSGKTTVMAMLAAWSILNKVHNSGDSRFSDTVLVVCPNVTIRSRLEELDPKHGASSLYYTRDLVPPDLRHDLTQGRLLVTNWHVFEPKAVQAGGVSAKVVKAGQEIRTKETIIIAAKTTTARGSRYMTPEALDQQIALGLINVLEEIRDGEGNLKKVTVEATRYVESDTALVNRILGRDVGGKQNILVFNDEAHHAYRIKRPEPDEGEGDAFEDDEDADLFFKEATIWVDGLDRIHGKRGMNFCVDLSATPYYLGRVGQETNRPFPWVVSDFGLIDAIESGLVKIPQLAVRDTTGAAIPGYFNVWHWIMPKLTPAERGGKRANPKPEAILKYAHTPIAMLAALWNAELERKQGSDDPRPPVFILVCKNTALAKVIYEWIGQGDAPAGIPQLKIPALRNEAELEVTIRVDSKVIHDTDDLEGGKQDETRWMRWTLDTVGRMDWPRDSQGRPKYPEGFEELAGKLERPLHPPGRDVRCIVSVGMLTEGWDCNTVTHIVGLRPFMSQLLCEQVVGRGLRRTDYDVGEDGKLGEEVAKVFGVPFEVIPFKANPQGAATPRPKRHHIQAIPQRAHLEIVFPRVDGYTQAVRNRVTINWKQVPPLTIDPLKIPPEVQVKGLSVNNQGRQSLMGPGRIDDVTLKEFRANRREQELAFDMARELTREYLHQGHSEVPAHALFPQLLRIARQYVEEKVFAHPPAEKKDLFLAPYYGWAIERLREAIRPDTAEGETPELPRYEANRKPGSTADVDLWTSRDVREVLKSHVNYMVADTKVWEQSAAYSIDTHPAVRSFVKNAGLGFAIPYLHNGQRHDYVPDFLIRLEAPGEQYLVLETKGYDPLEEVKRAAAERWVAAVNADGQFGLWKYAVAKKPDDVRQLISEAVASES
jgi:type III restriction enzyme